MYNFVVVEDGKLECVEGVFGECKIEIIPQTVDGIKSDYYRISLSVWSDLIKQPYDGVCFQPVVRGKIRAVRLAKKWLKDLGYQERKFGEAPHFFHAQFGEVYGKVEDILDRAYAREYILPELDMDGTRFQQDSCLMQSDKDAILKILWYSGLCVEEYDSLVKYRTSQRFAYWGGGMIESHFTQREVDAFRTRVLLYRQMIMSIVH